MTIIKIGISSVAAATGLPEYNDVRIKSGLTTADLNDTGGVPTGISLSGNINLADSATNNNVTGDVAPFVKAALDYYQFINNPVTLTFSGFTPNESVTFSFIGHSSTQGGRDTDVTINATTVTYDVSGTTTPNPPAVITETADGNGDLVVDFVSTVANNQYFSAIQLEYGVAGDTLTTTNTDLTYGDVVSMTSSITDATSAKVIDSALNEIALTGFTDLGANGADRDYSGTFPALTDGATVLLPDDNWTVEITNGVDTATVVLPRVALDGTDEIVVGTPAGTYTADDWAFGLDTPIASGDVAWWPTTAGITFNTDGTVTIDTEVFLGGVTITGWAQDLTDRRVTRIEKTYEAEADSTAPVLSSPTAVKTGDTTADASVTTDEGNGTLYWVTTTNVSESVAAIKAGNSQAVSTTGVQNVSITGLTGNTTYYTHFVQTDTSANDSLVVSSGSFTTDASPTAFTSVGSGDFNDPAVWDIGSGFPGPIDTFSIGAGHTITVPNGTTMESSGSLQGSSISVRGKLSIAFGGTFKQSGNVTLNSWNEIELKGTWDQNGHDLIGVASSTDQTLIRFVGTAVNRAKVISSVPATGRMERSDGQAMPGNIAVRYCDFVDAGFIRLGSNWAGMDVRIEDATFVRCNEFYFGGYNHAEYDLIIDRVDIRDTASTGNNIGIINRTRANGTTEGTGQVRIANMTVASGTSNRLRVELDYVNLNENIILKDVYLESVLGTDTEQHNVLMYYKSASLGSIDSGSSLLKNNWYIYTEVNNPHVFFDHTSTYSNIIIENTYDGVTITDRGDNWNISAVKDQTVNNILVLEKAGGVFANALGNNKAYNYSANHCTIVVDGQDNVYGHFFRTEGGGAVTGTLSMQSNLVVNTNPDITNRAINIDSGNVGDIDTMDYNNYFGYGANIYYNVSHATKNLGDAGYGLNDTTLDPMFFDDTRGFANYGSQIGTSTTSTAVIDEFMKINGFDSITETQVAEDATNLNVVDLLTWVGNGFRVQQPALENAGHDGVTIGAMPYIVLNEVLPDFIRGNMMKAHKKTMKKSLRMVFKIDDE